MSPLAPPPPGPLPPAPAPTESQVRNWCMWCHLSALAGLIIPFGNALGPLVVWLVKKNEIPAVDTHGKAALNFQLTVLIATLVGIAAAIILFFFACIGLLFIPVIWAISIAGIVFSIIAGIKASEGTLYQYPWSLTLIT